MEFITSIVQFIDKDQFRSELGRSYQLIQLFDIACEANSLDQSEVLKRMQNLAKNKGAFKRLKLRLRERLMEYLARTGIKYYKLDDYRRNYLKCLNKLSVAMLLTSSDARSAATDLISLLVLQTIKYEYTELALILARDLCVYYGTINYNESKIRKYKSICAELRDLYNQEIEASEYYCDLQSSFTMSRGQLKEAILSKAEKYSATLRPYLRSKRLSYQLIVDIYSVEAICCELQGNYHKLVTVCDEALDRLESRKVKRKSGYLQFDLYKIEAFIQLRKFEMAEKLAKPHFRVMTRGSFNWVILTIYTLLARFHSKDYQKALDITIEHEIGFAVRKLPSYLREIWTIYEAHLEFLIAIGKIKTDQPSKFRLHKFLNEIPLYTKDKKGLNIAILIIHVLFLLHQRKYSQIIDRTEALQLYCYRYLRKDDTFRSHCFIKMLLQMPRADFNRIRTERYAQPFVTKLRSMPLMISGQTIEVEIIPYEDLWKMTLDLLD